MSKSPAFQFYVNDWLGSANVMLMTPSEEGAYIRLLAIAWGSDDCGLPNDDRELSILSRLGEGWLNGASTKIRKCFIENGNRLYNKRLLEERKKQEIWKEKSRQGGIKSGRIRKNSQLSPERWLNDPLSGPVEPKGNSSSSSSSSKNNKTYSSFFLSFWEHYPKKKGKPNAFKEWNKLKPDLEVVLGALQAQIEEKERLTAENKFCPEWPDPERWIKNQRWLDEITDGPIEDRRMWEIEQMRKKNGNTEPT